MRKKSKLTLILITLVIIFTLLSINNYIIIDNIGYNEENKEIQDENNLKSPNLLGSYSESFIHIDGNWSHTVGNYTWCNGEGSWGNPYIIENVIIDASSSPTGSGIFINNSKSNYFIIRNCMVHNAGTGIEDAGIRLENTDNGTIKDNYYLNNGENGIFLNNYCRNITISGNTINDNLGVGIKLEDNCEHNYLSGNIIGNGATLDQDTGIKLSVDCNFNIITGNLIKNNSIYGILVNTSCQNNLIYQNSLIATGGWHARDDGIYNHWNVSGVGNYWDNHTLPEESDSDENGIVDNSYIWINGTSNSEDHRPLVGSPVHLGERIHIDDSGVNAWDWTKIAKLKCWCTGTGTKNDPYVIDGLEIDGGGSGSYGILIEESSIYFVIRNCIVCNVGGLDGIGIKLKNADNGALINNICSNNKGNGIKLDESQYGHCENNTISGNTINSNGLSAIYLYGPCYNTTISKNIINKNG